MGEPSPQQDPADTERMLAEAEAAATRGDWQTASALYARLVEGAAAPSGPLLVAWSEALNARDLAVDTGRWADRSTVSQV